MKSWGQRLQETVMTHRAGKRLELLKLRSLEEAPHGAGPLGEGTAEVLLWSLGSKEGPQGLLAHICKEGLAAGHVGISEEKI